MPPAGSIAPMPLVTYEEAKLFAPVIRYRVENRVMPPGTLTRRSAFRSLPTTGASLRQSAPRFWLGSIRVHWKVILQAPALEFNDALVWRLENQMEALRIWWSNLSPMIWPLSPRTNGSSDDSTGLTEERWVKAIEIRLRMMQAAGGASFSGIAAAGRRQTGLA